MDKALPQRHPLPRSRTPYRSLPLHLLERYRTALREWAEAPIRPGAGVSSTPPAPVTITEALRITRPDSLFRTEIPSGACVDWFEDDGEIHVVRLQLDTGEITDFPEAPDLGMCFDRMPREIWDAVRQAWETERDRRRGARWSCQTSTR